jgi:type 2 lantibiotic biosynthesis protein LanM
MKTETSRYREILDLIAARASTPPERQLLGNEMSPLTSEREVQARIQHFYDLVEATDDEKVEHLLAHHHLDRQQVASFLSSPSQRLAGPQPDWIEVLERIVTECSAGTGELGEVTSPDPFLLPEEPIPFEEVFLPFLRYAWQQLSQQTAPYHFLIQDKVKLRLERWLLTSFSWLASKIFLRKFLLFRKQQAHALVSSERSEIYEAFLDQYQGEGLLLFFQEYSVLARLLVLQVVQWIAVCTEFLQRLATDLDEIEKTFAAGQAVGPVADLQPDCSDHHHQGRTVFVLTFAKGMKVVYKPRCLQIERAFSDLLVWCNTHGLSPCLRPMRVLSRATHGWAEYIPQEPCLTKQEVQTYYQRSGMLLGLLYVLRGTDMHNENIIACGEHPMLIDMEMIASHGFPPCLEHKDLWDRSAPSNDLLAQNHSVLVSGLLPVWQWDDFNNRAFDGSGLASVDVDTQSFPKPVWRHINTDAMGRELVNQTGNRSLNTVLLQDEVVNPLEYGEEVVKGFSWMYHFLLAHRSALLAPDGPLDAFVGGHLRFVRRATRIYAQALHRLGHPDFLREGTDRWIELQVFTYPLLEVQDHPFHWKVAESELLALQCLDIPWFGSRFESHDLWLETGEILPDVFPLSALEQARAGLHRLNVADLVRQCQLIRTAYLTARPTEAEQEQWPPLAQELERQEPLRTADLVEVASQIGQELQSRAFHELPGTWMGLCYEEKTQWLDLKPVEFGLYRGACGIGLFLAVLARITGESTSRDLLISTFEPLCQKLKDAASSLSLSASSQWEIGGGNGLGSYMYALPRVGIWLDLPELLEAAWHASLLLTDQRVHADQSFDVTGGSAGALLGLLSLYECAPKAELLERAVMCGQHLLAQRVKTARGARSWPGPKIRPLTGFSHGAAGIAYALLRLAALTGEQAWKEAAEEAIAFEQSLFSPEVGNWPDLRELPEDADPHSWKEYGQSWCHGAPGIGLARLGGLAILDTPQVRSDLAVALQTTLHSGLLAVDCLCCGNCGCLDLLVTASRSLTQPHLLDVARQWSSVLVQRAKQQGSFRHLPLLPRQAYNPGLFQGAAGIGYQLLRVAFPDQVPSVLLWQ